GAVDEARIPEPGPLLRPRGGEVHHGRRLLQPRAPPVPRGVRGEVLLHGLRGPLDPDARPGRAEERGDLRDGLSAPRGSRARPGREPLRSRPERVGEGPEVRARDGVALADPLRAGFGEGRGARVPAEAPGPGRARGPDESGPAPRQALGARALPPGRSAAAGARP